MALEQTKVARVLAHKLSSQCHDSLGAYKILTTDVRKCRNILEQLEEGLSEETIDENRRVRALPAAGNARHILEKLDLAMQSYRCSKDHQIDHGIVVAFKGRLQSVTDELTAAYDLLTDSAEISIRFDSRPSFDSVAIEPTSAISSSSPSAKDDKRPQSFASSAWSTPAQPDAQSQSSKTEMSSMQGTPTDPLEVSMSDEKEAYTSPTFNTSLLGNGAVANRQRGHSMSYHSPLSIDPFLSTTLENASTSILGEDETVNGDSTRSRTSSIVDTMASEEVLSINSEHGLTQEAEMPRNDSERPRNSTSSQTQDGGAQATSVEDNAPTGQHAVDVEGESISGMNPISTGNSRWQERSATVRRISPHPAVETQKEAQAPVCQALDDRSSEESKDDSTPVTIVAYSPRHLESAETLTGSVIEAETTSTQQSAEEDDQSESDSSLDLPLAVLREQQRQGRFSNRPTPAGRRVEKAINPDPTTQTEPVHRTYFQGAKPITEKNSVRSNTPLQDSANHANDDCKDQEESATASNRTVEVLGPKIFDPSPVSEPESPPMPSRRPPPPPPPKPSPTYKPPHAVIPGAVYRIVNADPPQPLTRTASSASEDLYGSSRPSSPVRRATGSGPPQIPEIHLDNTPLGILDVNVPHESKVSNSDNSARDTLATISENRVPSTSARLEHQRPDNGSASAPLDAPAEKPPPPLPPRPRRQHTVSVSVLPNRKKEIDLSLAPTLEENSDQARRLRARSYDGNMNAPSKSRYNRSAKVTDKMVLNHRDSANRPQVVSYRNSVTAPERSNSTTAPEPTRAQLRQAPRTATNHNINGFYAPGSETEHSDLLDESRIEHICACWNTSLWDDAESYLIAHLESMVEQNNLDAIRRARHLLGVCASFRGDYAQATRHFLSTLNTPITDIALLDEGDCAAAWWLGDVYAVLNRRQEALLAYCIADRNPWFKNQSNFPSCLALEQQAVQLGATKYDVELQWANEGADATRLAEEIDSVIDTRIISKSAAKLCLQTQSRIVQSDSDTVYLSSPRHSRARILFETRIGVPARVTFHRVRISPSMFNDLNEWPMRYDPMFCMANVLKGRLLGYECDLLHVFRTNPDAKVPKSLGLVKKDVFTHADLIWIIKTLRDCLLTMGVEWSEVANVAGTWLCCRVNHTKNRIGFQRYFSINIFRQTLRSGYGVEVCPDEMVCSRLAESDFDPCGPTYAAEAKQYRKRIRSFMEAAARHYDGPGTSGTIALDGQPEQLTNASNTSAAV